ncbi:threonine-phosphate decarboxylase CobD [Novosphingobium olei]|uniref:threonine-phosphate decarboxylase n=1 Tax=Novosphingobium olei TaxID=2728851 RepID=A0A7Y0GC26_9SPHN|nr:threonine-phosphate decarboxylase CobD [Novosphingobium olei]NML95604.1 threonine-phosphate decarboxylase [Novosphingobium olei]
MTFALLQHGGRVDAAARRYGGSRRDWLDLSTGINPRPWPVAKAGHVEWANLPSPETLVELEAAAAAHFGCAPELCCAMPGSEAGMRLLARLIGLPGRAVPPTYRTHVDAFAESAPILFGEDPGAAATVMIANPANPDGTLRDGSALLAWHDRIAARDGWLVVDEAFADATPAQSVAGNVAARANLVVLRSFGKFFGLAGLRLGFAIAPPLLIASLRRAMGDWPLHAAALRIASAAYRDQSWIAQARIYLAARAVALDAMLDRHGLIGMGASPLFRLVVTPDAAALFERLARARILVRPFADKPNHLRFGVPADGLALARLDRALRDG